MNRPRWIGSALLLLMVISTGASLATWKYAAIQDSAAASANQPEPMESVMVAVAEEREHRQTTTSIGTVLALRSITLRNELAGTVRQIRLTPGQIVDAGIVLVALDVADLEETPEGLHVRIKQSKTDQEGAGDFVSIPHGSRLRPVAAVKAWLEAAGITEGPIFRPIKKGGLLTLERLSDRSVAEIIKKRAEGAGFDPAIFSGHSLRAGFVTSALHYGADILRVMDVTRHREVSTLKTYDRRAKAFKQHAGEAFL